MYLNSRLFSQKGTCQNNFWQVPYILYRVIYSISE